MAEANVVPTNLSSVNILSFTFACYTYNDEEDVHISYYMSATYWLTLPYCRDFNDDNDTKDDYYPCCYYYFYCCCCS